MSVMTLASQLATGTSHCRALVHCWLDCCTTSAAELGELLGGRLVMVVLLEGVETRFGAPDNMPLFESCWGVTNLNIE